MPWLTCRVELISRRSDSVIADEFEGRSIYECAWMALCEWCDHWYFDNQAPLVTVRHGEGVWHIRQERLREWRPIMRAQTARQMLFEAKLHDPEGKELSAGQR